jgi:hypothetical protein
MKIHVMYFILKLLLRQAVLSEYVAQADGQATRVVAPGDRHSIFFIVASRVG